MVPKSQPLTRGSVSAGPQKRPRRRPAPRSLLPRIILATLVVILSFLPMFFITGMMGPHMRPMALNVPVTMLMSMVVAFTITPWLSYHVLKGAYGKKEKPFVLERSLTYRFYRSVFSPFLDRRRWAWLLIGVTAVLFVLSVLLPLTGCVPLKMLPFDNKNEFQIVVDMPEGTTLETTDAVVEALGNYLQTVPEMTNFVAFSGTASPMDFNGMVRKYRLCHGPNVGEIRVNLAKEGDRVQQSHSILLRLRDQLKQIGQAHGANLKLVESPPGPPVFDTLVAEVYGRPQQSYDDLIASARHVRGLMELEPGVVEVDDTVEADQFKNVFVVDKVKASLYGIRNETIGATLQLAEEDYGPGEDMPLSMPSGSGILHNERDLNPTRIVLRLPEAQRSSLAPYVGGSPHTVVIRTGRGRSMRWPILRNGHRLPVNGSHYHPPCSGSQLPHFGRSLREFHFLCLGGRVLPYRLTARTPQASVVTSRIRELGGSGHVRAFRTVYFIEMPATRRTEPRERARVVLY